MTGVALLFAALPLFAGGQVTARRAALSTVSPQATQIGLSVLRRGGNAADAAVAVAFALAVAHPQAGNLGGGGFLVYYDAQTKGVWTLDFREVAPLAAKRDMYVLPDGSISGLSRTGPQSVAVPGSVAGLEALHERFGSRAWKELLQPSIALAREGVRIDGAFAADLQEAQSQRNIGQFTSTAALYFPDGKPLAAGARFVQRDLEQTLTRLAEFGARDFYDGQIADRLVEVMRAAGGNLGYRDLKEYRPIWRAPMQIRFREFDVYTMAPPSAGGLVIAEVLNILGTYDLKAAGFQTPRALHLFVEAARRAYIDRNKYLGDPATTRIPYRELLSAERAALWRASIDPRRVTATQSLAEPGTNVAEGAHTTHFSIVDEKGNIAAVTTTLNENFGSGFVAPGLGFFLNNEMDDFTPAPGKPNRYGLVQGTANAIDPGKRMASSMSPTLVMKGGKPFLVLGTRGGPTIPTSVLQVFLNVAIHGKPLAEAIAAPRYHHQALPDQIFYERTSAQKATIDGLNAMGHAVVPRDPIGDIHALMFTERSIIAVADPRAGGAAGGY